MLFAPQLDEKGRKPAGADGGGTVEAGMAGSTHRGEPAPLMASAAAVVDVQPLVILVANGAAVAVATEDGFALTPEAPPGIGLMLGATSAQRRTGGSFAAGAEEGRL